MILVISPDLLPRFILKSKIRASEATHVAFHAAIKEPVTIEEVFNSEYSTEWKEATDSEYQSLLENKTWDLVDLPENSKAIGCKWVFMVKYDENGHVDRFKGRLVAKVILEYLRRLMVIH